MVPGPKDLNEDASENARQPPFDEDNYETLNKQQKRELESEGDKLVQVTDQEKQETKNKV